MTSYCVISSNMWSLQIFEANVHAMFVCRYSLNFRLHSMSMKTFANRKVCILPFLALPLKVKHTATS